MDIYCHQNDPTGWRTGAEGDNLNMDGVMEYMHVEIYAKHTVHVYICIIIV